MRRYYGALFLLALPCVLPERGNAQQLACVDPTVTRIGVFTVMDVKTATGSGKREAEVEERMRRSLEKKLAGPSVCIVEDIAVFDDPRNFPLLKGSLLVKIYSKTSFEKPGLSAITVTLEFTQGPFFDQSLPIGPVTILIEKDADYDIGADVVTMYCSSMTKAIKKKSGAAE